MTTNLRKISFDLISSFKEKFRERFKDMEVNVIILGTVKNGQEVKYGLQADKVETIVSMVLVELMDSILKTVEEAKTPATPMTDIRSIKEIVKKEVEGVLALKDLGGHGVTEKEMNELLFGKRRSSCR